MSRNGSQPDCDRSRSGSASTRNVTSESARGSRAII